MNKILILFSSLLVFNSLSFSQCADSNNIYAFTYNGANYEIVKENKTWADAAACAVERGGFLARIDNQAEQDVVYDNVMNNAGVLITNTVAPDGGNASYVWLGGTDSFFEGNWKWDGNNDGVGEQFWQGTSSGAAVGGLYSNWGNEPDNWNNQDGLGLALTEWPLGGGQLGSAGQWNDVDDSNTLFFVIEYVGSVGLLDYNFSSKTLFYPNPVADELIISVDYGISIKEVKIFNELGRLILEHKYQNKQLINVDVSTIESGVYFVLIKNNNGGYARDVIIIK